MKLLAVCLVLSLFLSTFVAVESYMGCGNKGERCQLGGRRCCGNLRCRQSMVGGYRCERRNGGGGNNGNCIRRGNRCQRNGVRRCCTGMCSRRGGSYRCN